MGLKIGFYVSYIIYLVCCAYFTFNKKVDTKTGLIYFAGAIAAAATMTFSYELHLTTLIH